MQKSRRKFIETSVTASTALLFSSLQTFAFNKSLFPMNTNFDLKIMATNWGFNGTLDQYCTKAKKEGYDGIEI